VFSASLLLIDHLLERPENLSEAWLDVKTHVPLTRLELSENGMGE
jgi:hypothetical protein